MLEVALAAVAEASRVTLPVAETFANVATFEAVLATFVAMIAGMVLDTEDYC